MTAHPIGPVNLRLRARHEEDIRLVAVVLAAAGLVDELRGALPPRRIGRRACWFLTIVVTDPDASSPSPHPRAPDPTTTETRP